MHLTTDYWKEVQRKDASELRWPWDWKQCLCEAEGDLIFHAIFMLASSVEHNCSGHRTVSKCNQHFHWCLKETIWHRWIWLSHQTQNYKCWMKADYQIQGLQPYTKLNSGLQLREHIPCASSLLSQRTRFEFLQGWTEDTMNRWWYMKGRLWEAGYEDVLPLGKEANHCLEERFFL